MFLRLYQQQFKYSCHGDSRIQKYQLQHPNKQNFNLVIEFLQVLFSYFINIEVPKKLKFSEKIGMFVSLFGCVLTLMSSLPC